MLAVITNSAQMASSVTQPDFRQTSRDDQQGHVEVVKSESGTGHVQLFSLLGPDKRSHRLLLIPHRGWVLRVPGAADPGHVCPKCYVQRLLCLCSAKPSGDGTCPQTPD